MFYRLVFTLLMLAGIFQMQAQQRDPQQQAWLIQPSFAFQFPGGDMSERFGNNMTAGLAVGYKLPGNWIVGVDAQYLFSDKVKNIGQLLNPVLTGRGQILNQTGNYATVSVSQRGTYGSFDLGKTLPLLSANANSGISLQAGAGYLVHWVHISNSGNDSPQINGEYKKGYDELTGGFMLKQSLGYTYLSSNRRINFRASFEVLEGFTENWRGYSYSTGQEVSGSRLDLLYGFRIQWILPIYQSASDQYYYD